MVDFADMILTFRWVGVVADGISLPPILILQHHQRGQGRARGVGVRVHERRARERGGSNGCSMTGAGAGDMTRHAGRYGKG